MRAGRAAWRIRLVLVNRAMGVWARSPDLHAAVVRSCGEHEGVGGWVPGNTRQIAAALRMWTEVM